MAECVMCGGSGGWPGVAGWVTCKPCNGAGQVVHKTVVDNFVVHALTVTPNRVVHALTVTGPRINCDATNRSLYSLVANTLVVRGTTSVDNSAKWSKHAFMHI